MKPITVALLALTVATALPLAAQQTPPTETTETTEATAATKVDTATSDTQQQPPAAAPTPAPAVGAMSAEQQAMMEAWQKAATPGAQHQQLIEQFAGQWDATITMWMDPAAAPMIETGTSTNTAVLGDRHLRMDYSGQFMGQPFDGVGYSGYNNVTGKYFSSWMDNTSTGLHVTHGDYDDASQTYTYRSEMPDMMNPGSTVPVREVVKVVDADHHVIEWFETRDGEERKTMQIEFTRAD